MKQWKTVLVTAVIVSLVAILTFTFWKTQKTYPIRSRIGQYRLMKEEQQLMLDILKLRYETTVIQSKFQPAPTQNVPPTIKE